MAFINQGRFNRKLRLIPEQIRKRAKADLLAGAREINILQRALVPKEDGVLAASIRNEVAEDPDIAVIIRAGGPSTTVTVREGSGVEYDYALAQEFGTSKQPPNSFFYPAVNARRKKVMRDVRTGWRRILRQQKSQ